jgi:hypothetical protein
MLSLRAGCIQCKRAQDNGTTLRGPNDGDAISANKILDSEVIKGAQRIHEAIDYRFGEAASTT